MIHSHNKFHLTKTTEMSLARIFMSISFAALETVWALYMYRLGLMESQIGILASLFIGIAFITALFVTTPSLEKLHAYKLFLLSSILLIISLMGIGLTFSFSFFLIFAITITIARTLNWNSFQILFRNNSAKASLAKNEGLFFTLANLGWFTGPLIAGYILSQFGINSVFIASSIIFTVGLTLFVKLRIKHPAHIVQIKKNTFVNIIKFIHNKKTHIPFIIATGKEFFWSLIYIFIPVYIVKQFQSESYVGLFLATVTIPLILLEYFAGKVAMKKGFLPVFQKTYLSLALLCFISLFFIDNPYIILSIFILTSIPMAFTESLTDAFFFHQINQKDEEKLYPIFTTADTIGGITGRLSLGLIIGIFSFQSAIILMGCVMFTLFIFATISKYK